MSASALSPTKARQHALAVSAASWNNQPQAWAAPFTPDANCAAACCCPGLVANKNLNAFFFYFAESGDLISKEEKNWTGKKRLPFTLGVLNALFWLTLGVAGFLVYVAVCYYVIIDGPAVIAANDEDASNSSSTDESQSTSSGSDSSPPPY